MLNGREYIPFDIDEPQEGLVKLTDWVNIFARRNYSGALIAPSTTFGSGARTVGNSD
jgi:hypothetical protein